MLSLISFYIEFIDEGSVLESIKTGLAEIPLQHKVILSSLLSFIKLILENQDVNKMAAHNLAVVWGPNRMCYLTIPIRSNFFCYGSNTLPPSKRGSVF